MVVPHANQQECKKLGIEGGSDLRSQLAGLTKELPRHLTSLLEALRVDQIKAAAE